MEQMSTNNNAISRFLKKSRDKKPSILIEIVESDPTQGYKILREPYKNNDFIPPQLIFQIVKHHFNSAELLHSFSQIICYLKYKLRIF